MARGVYPDGSVQYGGAYYDADRLRQLYDEAQAENTRLLADLQAAQEAVEKFRKRVHGDKKQFRRWGSDKEVAEQLALAALDLFAEFDARQAPHEQEVELG